VATALTVVPLLLAACSSASTSSSTTATTSAGTTGTTVTTTPQVAAAPSPGCGTAASPGTVTLTLTIDGKQRLAIVHVPTGYRATTPVPLVLNMHGSQSTALQQEGLTGMDATSDADTFIVAYPQGDITAGTGFEWNVPDEPLLGGGAVPAGSPDDVSFLTQLVTLLGQKYCIDTRRVFATGFSGGARMASQLACDASGVFAAVAPVSGLRFPTPCPSTRPVPVIAFHGTADPVDPYRGDGQQYWTYGVPLAAKRWGSHNGCARSPQRQVLDPTVVITQYAPCTADADVELYTIAGEGHEWPGGTPLPSGITAVLGPQSRAVSANDLMWEFFVAHPLPTG
jgi:polyhydroxybutyrate depolymerase